jgi:tetratricopeptide (TPR) repeat protein
MLNWLNPFKWWRIFQQNRQWKIANRQFINSYHQQDFITAEVAGRLMVEIATKLGRRQLLLDSYYNLMLCYGKIDRLDSAIDCGERVLALQQTLSSNPDDRLIPDRMCDLANLYQQQNLLDDAVRVYGQALTISKRIDGSKGSRQLINILESLAAIDVTRADGDRSPKLLAEAQTYRRKLGLVADSKSDRLTRDIEQIESRHRGEHLTELEQWRNLMREAGKLYETGEIRAAIPIYEQALTIAREIFPAIDNDLASSLNNLAGLYRSQGRWAEAEPSTHANTLIFAADSELYRVPFATLPLDLSGTRLIDKYRVETLTAARDLRRRYETIDRPSGIPIIVGDPDYDYGSSASLTIFPHPSKPDGTMGGDNFDRMPITKELTTQIATQLNVTPYLDTEATSHIFQQRSPKIMIVATHGFAFTKTHDRQSVGCPR